MVPNPLEISQGALQSRATPLTVNSTLHFQGGLALAQQKKVAHFPFRRPQR
jgi:hypothetical protein